MSARVPTRLRLAIAMLGVAFALQGCDLILSDSARYERAEKSEAAGNFAAAALDAKKLVQANSANSKARLMLARLYTEMGDVRGADAELTELAKQGVPAADLAEIRADTWEAMGRGADLLKWVETNRAQLREPALSVYRGRALNALNRPRDAQERLQGALATAPDSVEATTAMAISLAMQGGFDDALARLAPITQSGNVAATDARILQSRLLMRRGQYAAAETTLDNARKVAGTHASIPQQLDIALGITEAQLAQGKIDEATRSSEAFNAIAPGALAARLTLARLALARGDYLNGTAELTRVVNSAPDLVQARMLLGAAHFSQGNYMQAATQLEKVIQQTPDNVEARKLLGRIELELDHPDAALRVLSSALESTGSDSQLFALAGEAGARSGEPDVALEVLKRNAEARPKDGAAQIALAAAYVRAGRFDAAIPLLRAAESPAGDLSREALLVRALLASQGSVVATREVESLIQKRPDDQNLRLFAASYFGTQREFERAKSEIQAILKTHPADMRALVTLARLEFAAGQRPAAEAALQAALKSDSKSVPVRLMLAQLRAAGNDMPGARRVLDEAVAISSGDSEVIHSSGLILLDAGLLDEALARFRRASELRPRNPVYWLSTARAQAALNQPVAARESINKALELRPDWVAAEAMMVMLDLRSNGSAAALSRAEALRAKHPSDAAVWVLEGDAQMYAHHYSEAASAYAQASRLAPDSTTAIKQFDAVRLANRERPEQALELWLGSRPDDVRARTVLAQYLASTGREDRAITEFEFIAAQLPGNPAILNNLAWLYQAKRDPRAEVLARKAHDLAPTNPAVADTYGWILLSARKVEEAVTMLKVAADGMPADATVQYHYAAALSAAGKVQEARTVLTRALQPGRGFTEKRDAEKLLAGLENHR
ncbi:MAG: tetratricopeptide repeat protein [Gammaproteobacteria bacterium]